MHSRRVAYGLCVRGVPVRLGCVGTRRYLRRERCHVDLVVRIPTTKNISMRSAEACLLGGHLRAPPHAAEGAKRLSNVRDRRILAEQVDGVEGGQRGAVGWDQPGATEARLGLIVGAAFVGGAEDDNVPEAFLRQQPDALFVPQRIALYYIEQRRDVGVRVFGAKDTNAVKVVAFLAAVVEAAVLEQGE